jgi:hypothetical protein
LHGRPPKLLKVSTKAPPRPTHQIEINKAPQPATAQATTNTISDEFKEKVKQTINQRLLGLKGEVPAPVKPEDSPDVRVVVALLRQIKHLGYNSIAFTYSNNEIIEIFCGRPQKQVSHLRRIVVKRFLEAIELHDLHIPQVRNLALALNKEKYDKIFLELHSIPTVTGASVKITIT